MLVGGNDWHGACGVGAAARAAAGAHTALVPMAGTKKQKNKNAMLVLVFFFLLGGGTFWFFLTSPDN
jgi:hypothetical protein